LGWLILSFFGKTNFDYSHGGFAIGAGALLSYLAVLIFHSLQKSQNILLGLGLIGLVLFIHYLFRHRNEFSRFKQADTLLLGAFFIYVVALNTLKAIGSPIIGWDGRSIWFFHAKMIWSHGALDRFAGWDLDSVQFSHVAYPKLVATLAAQFCKVVGFWNEYIPKVALVVMILPPVLWIMSFGKKSISFLFLVGMLFLGMNQWLWVGDMDGIFALYAGSAVLLAGRYFELKRKIDFLSLFLCLALLSNIKSEGTMFFVAFILSVASYLIFSKQKIWPIFGDGEKISVLMLVGIAAMFLPAFIWAHQRSAWHMISFFQVGKPIWFQTIKNGLADGSLKEILKNFLVAQSVGRSLLLVLIATIALHLQGKKPGMFYMPALATAFFYFCGLVLIFLGQSNNLQFFLDTAAERTLLGIFSCLAVASYFLLSSYEDGSASVTSFSTPYGRYSQKLTEEE